MSQSNKSFLLFFVGLPLFTIVGWGVLFYERAFVGTETGKIPGITRIMMNDSRRYTYFTNNLSTPQVLEMKKVPDILHDASKESDMWIDYSCKKRRDGDVGSCQYVIHVHSVGEVEGGGWNHGKFGSGQNVVLE